MVQTRQKVFRIVPKCPKMSQVVPKCPKMSQNAHFKRIVIRMGLLLSFRLFAPSFETECTLRPNIGTSRDVPDVCSHTPMPSILTFFQFLHVFTISLIFVFHVLSLPPASGQSGTPMSSLQSPSSSLPSPGTTNASQQRSPTPTQSGVNQGQGWQMKFIGIGKRGYIRHTMSAV